MYGFEYWKSFVVQDLYCVTVCVFCLRGLCAAQILKGFFGFGMPAIFSTFIGGFKI